MAAGKRELLRRSLDERLERNHGFRVIFHDLIMPSRSFSFPQFRGAAHLLQAHPDETALRKSDHGLHGVEPECRRFKTRHFVSLAGPLFSHYETPWPRVPWLAISNKTLPSFAPSCKIRLCAPLRPEHHLQRFTRFGDEAEALLRLREREPVGNHLLDVQASGANERERFFQV